MGIYVNTNVSALRGRQYLSNVNDSLNTTYQRLSSGLRISSAKDDAAGLNISDRLTAQINGLNQGNRNANDAIALAQTIEGGLDEITNMLQRMRTLAVQASNGINTDDDRIAIGTEAAQLTMEISRIADQTTYGGKTILAGYTSGDSIYGDSGGNTTKPGYAKNSKITFQIGSNSGDTISLEVNSFQFSNIAARAIAGNLSNTKGLVGITESATTSIGGISSADVVEHMGTQTAYTMYFFALSEASSAMAAISTIDNMLKDVDGQRSNLGALQNRLESSIRVQSNVATNESDQVCSRCT